jgi:hypothetical protein
MKTITVYYPNNGAFNCLETAVQIELAKLPEDDRRTVKVICLPESMKKKQRKRTDH